jgi:hypothetical protein
MKDEKKENHEGFTRVLTEVPREPHSLCTHITNISILVIPK